LSRAGLQTVRGAGLLLAQTRHASADGSSMEKGFHALVAVIALGLTTLAADSPSEAPEQNKASQTKRAMTLCPGGFSSGLSVLYIEGGGEASAVAALARVSGVVERSYGSTLEPHIVQRSGDKVVVQYFDDSGVIARGSVIRVGSKWQIHDVEQCQDAH
jgi:hypothetical protein